MNKSILIILAVALSSVRGARAAETQPSAPVAPAKASQADPADEIVARGKGVSVKRRQLAEAVTVFKASAAAQGQTAPEAERQRMEADILERLVVTQILIGKATAEDKAKAKELAGKVVGGYRDRARTEERFTAQLKAMGLTEEGFRGQVLDQAVCEQVLDRELRAKLNIGADQAKKFYDENPAQFQEPDRVRAAHILISTQDAASGQSLPDAKVKEKKEFAEKILARAKAGEDFAKLAKEFSDDPGSKDSSGEYTFPRGQMVPEFEAATFSMGTNQISDLVTTRYGFHIIRLNEKLPARKVEFAQAEKDIKEYLVNEELKQQLPGYFEKLKTEAAVEMPDAKAKTTAPASPN